jgi:predicted amidohydrolase
LRAALACIRCPKGDVEGNLMRHRTQLVQAREAGADIVVFPEMSLNGYLTPNIGYRTALTLTDEPVRQLVSGTRQIGVAASFGIVERLPVEGFAITQIVAAGGEVLAVQRKRHLGEGEDHFSAWESGAAVADIAGTRVAVAICAEARHDEPFAEAAAAGAAAVLVSSAPGLEGRRTDEAGWRDGFDWWRSSATDQLAARARDHGLYVALASQSGATEDEDFPGWGALFGPDGAIRAELPDWREATLLVDIHE